MYILVGKCTNVLRFSRKWTQGPLFHLPGPGKCALFSKTILRAIPKQHTQVPASLSSLPSLLGPPSVSVPHKSLGVLLSYQAYGYQFRPLKVTCPWAPPILPQTSAKVIGLQSTWRFFPWHWVGWLVCICMREHGIASYSSCASHKVHQVMKNLEKMIFQTTVPSSGVLELTLLESTPTPAPNVRKALLPWNQDSRCILYVHTGFTKL
jgi:hypothetical protein